MLYEVSIQKIGIGTFVVTHLDGLNVDLLAIKNELSKINSQPKLKNMHTHDFFDRTLYVLPNTIMVRHLLNHLKLSDYYWEHWQHVICRY